jgi:class I fructose-bisphosphate aldolase/fructose-bisphosphate aldolase/2-amino-3,7-dideoxy-D-threo-hept-6-ulosonate synthase
MTGKIVRMNRLMKDDGKTVIVALDHGQFNGPIDGIDSIQRTLTNIMAGQPDGIILNPGVIEKNARLLSRDTCILCRITGASTNYSTLFDYHRVTTSVEHAAAIGADAVIVMGFIGGTGENKSLEIIAKTAEECSKHGIPLVAEMLPQAEGRFTDPDYIALGARAAYELGADLLKVYYTGKETFSRVVESVPIPIVIAGGPKGEDLFDVAQEAISLGAKGVAFGRNVFQADDQTEYVRHLLKAVHG